MIVNDGKLLTNRGYSIYFLSDHGVFSKNEMDFGSRLLIETFNMPDIKGNILDVGCGKMDRLVYRCERVLRDQ